MNNSNTNNINKKYNINLEVITPLYIGGNNQKNWTKGLDYIYDNKKVYIIDHDKIAQILTDKEISNWANKILEKKSEEYIKNYIIRTKNIKYEDMFKMVKNEIQ
mgnify:CR=1 FL=1